MNKLLILIPTAFDLISSTLQYIALNFISSSSYQMLRGGTIVTTYIFSKYLLRARMKRHQTAGAIVALVGILIVGGSNSLFSISGGSDESIVHVR